MNTPVALIIFNRPETTERVFAEIAKARPKKLFLIADGPRPDRPGEADKCAAARAIVDRVDWECEVFKNYSKVNLGCGLRPATGISWVFEHVEEAIILEDDCVPHPTFIGFCEELLERFRFDERVMMIAGRNSMYGRTDIQMTYSYHFSRLLICWGWATWRRSWQYFDMEIKLWPSLRGSPWLMDILRDTRAVEEMSRIFEQAHAAAGNVDYWDYQWNFTCWAQNGLVILPNTNLVSYIGFGPDATHTKSDKDARANTPVAAMKFPLQHPPHMLRDTEADERRVELSYPVTGASAMNHFYKRIRRTLSSAVSSALRRCLLRS